MLLRAKSSFEEHGSFKPASGAAILAFALLVAASIGLSQAAPTQATFTTPVDAGRALVSALQAHDERAVRQILSGGSEIMGADGKAEDALDRQHFVQKYQEMHRWARESDETKILYIGAENWSFPVPLVSSNGVWRFDSKAGADEIRFRRIGENELMAIGLCDTLVQAKSSPGTDTEVDDLVKTLFPLKSASKPIPFHGYRFRMLSKSDGSFTAIAYPAAYRSSGVMTFIVTQEGSVWEKDLGPSTATIAKAIQSYQPDATWAQAE
jgi:hypothetical protein